MQLEQYSTHNSRIEWNDTQREGHSYTTNTLTIKNIENEWYSTFTPDWNIMIHYDRTTVYTTNTCNIPADFELNVHT